MGRLIFYIVATSYLRRGRRDVKLRDQDVLRKSSAEWNMKRCIMEPAKVNFISNNAIFLQIVFNGFCHLNTLSDVYSLMRFNKISYIFAYKVATYRREFQDSQHYINLMV